MTELSSPAVASTPAPTSAALEQAPRFDVADAERLAREHYGFPGTAAPLTSERDQNFLIERVDGSRIILKIANGEESRALLLAQQEALTHLSPALATTPRVVPAVDGTTLTEVSGRDGTTHLLWAITWLPGRPLATATRRTPELYEDFGRQIGALDRALADFDHPAIHRAFYWDLANGRSIVDQHRRLIGESDLQSALDRLIAEFDRTTAPLLAHLPRAAVHSDLNDYNVLVGGGHDPETRDQRITGIVDFGDMVHSYRVADLATAIAYAVLDSDDSLTIASHVIRGYREHVALDDNELASLFGLVVLRLCMSVCIAADQLRQQPDNLYLGVSQSAIQRMLPKLAMIPFGLAHPVFREAAGMESVPARARVIAYLGAQSPAPVIGIDPRREPTIVLDLSVASPLMQGDVRQNAEAELTERVFAMMREANVRVAIGRYDEPRLLYVAPAFATGERPTDEHRTIHIGLDLFADAGTPVFAPLDGTVHAFADNATPQDYGPVIILRHATDDGTAFFTLYGHLSRESLLGLEVGRRVAAGDQIATLGTPEVNGGWTPHLHLQIITDLLGLGTDFPGVARPTQRGVWCALCPDPNLIVRVPSDRFPVPAPSKLETLARRRARIGHNLSIAYKDPVKIVRGWMQYLYDDDGRKYVDAYNNVPHVGHCHPRVVEAGAAQMRVLSTNTRYLNDRLTEYADRLLATLPPSLDVCYFVNSASEANELALRLTRAYTGHRDMIVLAAAYHGNTTSLIDLSPYKNAGPGGSGAPEWVHVAPLPDDYRGPFKRSDPAAGEKYARQVADLADAIRARGRQLAGFIAETCPSVGGQLMLPRGYLTNVYQHVRRAGGVCIADEVQTGLGRMGTSFWAFEDHGVVPDIVVMGKPLGNGHPIGAVATTRAIADAFDNGMEFFSTFGGNTVSCAIGIAVLDVLRDEALQSHALRVGDHLLSRLRPLIDRYPIVGDVRGTGLFLGIELVRDRETLEPAGDEASFVANRMRERGVLLGTDGPYHNVVKIRPPMPFAESDADLLVDALAQSIAELPA
jgi:4-aminobutyrate aminotransferase-like enzyme/Ser/Thr protein kinase RdoA (MazF antagonist)